eukprot:7376297-Prymnesium_polylepis.1
MRSSERSKIPLLPLVLVAAMQDTAQRQFAARPKRGIVFRTSSRTSTHAAASERCCGPCGSGRNVIILAMSVESLYVIVIFRCSLARADGVSKRTDSTTSSCTKHFVHGNTSSMCSSARHPVAIGSKLGDVSMGGA